MGQAIPSENTMLKQNKYTNLTEIVEELQKEERREVGAQHHLQLTLGLRGT